MQRPLKIGTRGSPLALYQARLVQRLLAEKSGVSEAVRDTQFPICIFVTSGDKLKGHLSEFGGKGLFTKELEGALISGEIDMAVHSMKDVPTLSQEALKIGAMLEREDPRDAFVSLIAPSIKDLPRGAKIGTASLRRRAQLAALRPDIQFELLRGNVGTRLGKLKSGVCEATFLAFAGLKRLNREDAVTEIVDAEVMLNAPAQGAIGIEIRKNDDDVEKAVLPLNHVTTQVCVAAERAFLRALDGSCRMPIAALGTLTGKTMRFRGEVLSSDGQLRFRRDVTKDVSSVTEAQNFGTKIGREILAEIGNRNIWTDVT